MAGSTKVLTVSYGTFSCTAEGFDDPLGAVRDTTQFFRGVVKEDRFFGAEPPKYDPQLAEALLRKQIASDFDAEQMRLRPSADRDASIAWTDPGLPDPRTPVADGPWADTLGPVTETALPMPQGTAGLSAASSIADKLARIRAAVSDAPASAPPTQPAPAAEQAEPSPDQAATDSASPEPTGAFAPDTQGAEPGADTNDAPSVQTDAVDASFDMTQGWADTIAPQDNSVTSPDSAGFETPPATDAWDATAPADDSGDDVDAIDNAAWTGDALGVADPADTPMGAATQAQADADAGTWTDAHDPAPQTDAGVSGYENADDALNVQADDTDTAMSEDAINTSSASDSVWGYDDQPEYEPAPNEDEDPYAADDERNSADDDPYADMMAEVESGSAPRWTAQRRFAPPPESEVAADGSMTDDEPAAEEPAAVAPSEETPPRRRTRVISVKRQYHDRDAAEELEVRQPSDGKYAAGVVQQSSLDPDEDAALQAELAAIRDGVFDEEAASPEGRAAPLMLDNPIVEDDDAAYADAPDPAQDADPVDLRGVRKAVKLSNPGRAILTERSVGDADESRLMDRTDTALDEPEGNRRRSAIAHLRAAVAARRNDKSLGRRADSEDETNAYRDDLATVVRPQRPRRAPAPAPAAAPARGDDTALRLVDTADASDGPQEPVQPRRIARTADAAGARAPDAGGFAAYAAEVGATALPDLLEAAASYMAFVEGRDQFSRPQLMSVVQRADGGQATREERLRSFGRLLRDGKIEKTNGGRFAAAPSIGFRPDARAVG